jgi:uncharacterized membrane protein YozB (DUF420 family)
MSDGDDDMAVLRASEISSLSDAQVKVISILPIIPALGSLCASILIVTVILRSRKRTVYRRLLLGTSCCDICQSLFTPMQAFLLPRETSQRVWAFGNDATCSMMGFMSQFTFSIFIYSTMLSFYFLLTVRYSVREETISKRIEPFMHIFAIGYPLITAIVGAIKGMYHETEISPMCWVTDYPKNCGDDPWDSGEPCKGELMAWIFGGILIFPAMISLIVNNALIYGHVRRTTFTAQKRSSIPIDPASQQRQRREVDSQTQRVREVAIQAFLYVFAFLITYIWTILLRLLESAGFDAEDENSIYFLLVLQSALYPSQGVWNMLVYVRPKYSRCRRDFPFESKVWCFLRSLFEEEVKPRYTLNNAVPSHTSQDSSNLLANAGNRMKIQAGNVISGWFSIRPSSEGRSSTKAESELPPVDPLQKSNPPQASESSTSAEGGLPATIPEEVDQ